MSDNEWIKCGLHYEGKGMESKVIAEYIYDSEDERAKNMKKLQEEIGFTSFGIWDRDINGEHKYFFQIHEITLVDLPKGYMTDFPWLDLLYGNYGIESTIFSIENDYTIDESIREILLKLNKLGFQTWSSCSGLIEDHIDDFPDSENEMSSPFILFDDIKDYEILKGIIEETEWEIERRDFEKNKLLKGSSDFLIHSDIDGDLNVLKLWKELNERFK